MKITPEHSLKKLIIVGDRVLVLPSKNTEKTQTGIYLPQGVKEKEKVQTGYIVKVGPGFVLPLPEEGENWKSEEEKIKYVPLQAREGDLAIFLAKEAIEIDYDNQKYFIVSQSSILMLEREDDLF